MLHLYMNTLNEEVFSMSILQHTSKKNQQLMPLFDGAFIENKPIPFPNWQGTKAYSNLFYWAHLEAKQSAEFPLHPHEGFEIMTFIFKGSLEHFDTATEVWTTLNAGDVQVIQAGSGVQHAERISQGSELFQIWFDPDFSLSLNKSAAYKDYTKKSFIIHKEEGLERVVYLKDRGPVSFDTQGLEIQKLHMTEGRYSEPLDKEATYSFYLLKGRVKINNNIIEKDDFLVLAHEEMINILAQKEAELFMIKSPSHIEYERFIQRY